MGKLVIYGDYEGLEVYLCFKSGDNFFNKQEVEGVDGVFEWDYYNLPASVILIEGSITEIETRYSPSNPSGEQLFVLDPIGAYADDVDLDGTYWVDVVGGDGGGGGDDDAEIIPFNKVYLLDDEKLKEFSESNPMGSMEYEYNGADYVISLIRVPLTIPENWLGDDREIRLGFEGWGATGVYAPIVTTENVTIDLGDIEIPYDIDSLSEYGVSRTLHIPYLSNTLEIPKGFFAKSFNVKLILDVYSGRVGINLFSDLGNSLYMNGSVGRTIPVLPVSSKNSDVGTEQGSMTGLKRLMLQESRPEILDGFNTPLVELVGGIGDVVGYVEVIEHSLDGVVLGDDLDGLEQVITGGFYVK